MIYFDNAATSLPKPQTVYKAVEAAMLTCGNPGRSGHKASLHADRIVYDCRESIADLFGLPEPERVIFTQNATHALNIAIKSQLHDGGHAVISGYEHNSVARPLQMMKNVTFTVVHTPLFDCDKAFEEIAAAVKPDTKCIISTHVSNVFGFILPLERLDRFCGQKGIKLIIDASQSAGILPIDIKTLPNTSFICMPGHKALYGPQGTGILLCGNTDSITSIMEGGTGSESSNLNQPDMLPDMLESGTLNVCGIAGLLAGVKYVSEKGLRNIYENEESLCQRLVSGLYHIDGLKVFYDKKHHCGPVSIVSTKMPSEELCFLLGEKGFCLRGGLHCSPLAHISAGTQKEGTARISFSVFSTEKEVDSFLEEIRKLQKEA